MISIFFLACYSENLVAAMNFSFYEKFKSTCLQKLGRKIVFGFKPNPPLFFSDASTHKNWKYTKLLTILLHLEYSIRKNTEKGFLLLKTSVLIENLLVLLSSENPQTILPIKVTHRK